MTEKRDDIIEDILVDSELAKKLVPNKFKFTSHQGRSRRQKLLMGAKKLSETQPVSEISLADVCEEAGIPRASAYHFFPNVEAIFLALRFLNAIEILDALNTVQASKYNRWQGYVTGLMEKAVEVFNEDETKAKLIYEVNTPDFKGDSFGEQIDGQVIKLFYDHLSDEYEIAPFESIKSIMLVAYSISQGVFTLSYRQYGHITDDYLQEAITAAIAYLRCYLPEKLPKKQKVEGENQDGDEE